MQVKELIKHLQKSFKPTDHVAYILWQSDDIRQIKGDKFSEKQINNALDDFHFKQDLCVSKGWEVLEEFIDNYFIDIPCE